MMRLAIILAVVILVAGCGLLPNVAHQPTIHNPFPQLSKVAVAPFINLSSDPTVDGRQFGLAYFAELQTIPGFEVVPIGVVETAMRENHITISSAADCRRLAQLLGVDAVVVGAVTDFDPYYPPRCAMQVEWYSANPGFHPIPPGYGLPWGTPAEEDIPQPLVLETEMGLARAQLKTQTPAYQPEPPAPLPARRPTVDDDSVRFANGQSPTLRTTPSSSQAVTQSGSAPGTIRSATAGTTGSVSRSGNTATSGRGSGSGDANSQRTILASANRPVSNVPASPTESVVAGRPIGPAMAMSPSDRPGLPPDWPDPSGLIPPPPSAVRPVCHPSDEPVMRHTRTYYGNDPEFTTALQSYVDFRDDARFGGWAAYLQRSDDFIRFCCHKHIAEMLTARGGAGQTRVVLRWSDGRYIP
jgi:hypothetical protein